MSKVFISGLTNSGKLSEKTKDMLNKIIQKNDTVLIGDNQNTDTLIQTYLDNSKYKNVVIYYSDRCHNIVNSDWPTKNIPTPDNKYTRMAEDADYGIILCDNQFKDTNIEKIKNKMKDLNKDIMIYRTDLDKFEENNKSKNTNNKIDFCGSQGEYGFLSNFYPCDIKYNNITYKNTEAAFQAQKCPDRAQEFSTMSPNAAKKAGRYVKLRPDWENVKYDIMIDVLRSKFSIPELQNKLLATGDAYITENTKWHDNTWGNCTCPNCIHKEGKNLLGKALMQVRDEFKEKSKKLETNTKIKKEINSNINIDGKTIDRSIAIESLSSILKNENRSDKSEEQTGPIF